MTRRRRIARLLDCFGRWVFGPYVEAWAPTTQADLDTAIEHATRND